MEHGRRKGEEDSVSPDLSDAAFIAAVDGEADEETLEFLRNYPQYAHEVELTQQLQELLRTRLYRLFCPSSDTLTKYRLGSLDSEQRNAVAEHIATCPHCAKELGLLEAIVGKDKSRPDSDDTVRPE